MSAPFLYNPSRLRYDRSPTAVKTPHRIPRHRPGQHFLKGPIPWAWLVQAGSLRGAALSVALKIWQLAGIQCAATIEFSASRAAREFGLDGRSGRRGLKALERAGLIRIGPRRGRKPIVDILDRPADGQPEGAGDLPEGGGAR